MATGDTPEEAIRLMREGIPLHVEALIGEDGSVPQPQATAIEMEVPLTATA